ncbi:MAG: hypothetical protein V7K23_24935 [Nostoc sp.]
MLLLQILLQNKAVNLKLLEDKVRDRNVLKLWKQKKERLSVSFVFSFVDPYTPVVLHPYTLAQQKIFLRKSYPLTYQM